LHVRWALAAGALLLTFAAATPVGAMAAPNIVLIVADDVGYGDIGFMGCRDIPTPHIDGIAAAGVRFTDGYVTAPACSPSRAGLLTGRYQTRFGHEFNPEPPTPGDPTDTGLPLTETTIADALKAAGYRTGAFGKWHLGASPAMRPLRRGFDAFYGFLGPNHPYIPVKGAAPIFRNNKKVPAPAHLTTAIGEQAAAFVKRQADEPFFLYMPFSAAHTPLQPDAEQLARLASIEDLKRRRYAALVTDMDDAIGQVLQAVRDAGQEDNTLVLFYSDNGGPQEHNGSSNAPLRGDKLSLWDGGIRIPFAMQFKGKIPAGTVYDQPVLSIDATATAAAVGGATLGGPGRAVDGVDLLPYVTGEKSGAPHKSLYWRFGTQHAIREGDYKLVQFGDSPAKLYNLAVDAGEQHDLAAEQPGRVKSMLAAYDVWNAEQSAPLWKKSRMDPKTDLVVPQ